MRIFKSKTFRRIVSLILLVCMIVLLDAAAGFILAPVSYATYFNHDIRLIERSDLDADIVFIGASRVYRAFVPQVFEDSLGVGCVINAGSSSQPLSGTYYELKDLIERVHPRRVFIGVTMEQLLTEESLQGKLIVYDRLSPGNRLLMGLRCFSLSEMKYMSSAYRFKDYFVRRTVRANFAGKLALIRAGYRSYSENTEYYADTGFVYSYETCETGTIPIMGGYTVSPGNVLPEAQAWLDGCVDLCRRNGIEVTLFTGVTSVMRMYATENYQGAVDYLTDYADARGMAYYDLNYLRGREDFLPDELMHDYNHVNGEGAYVLSGLFAEIIGKASAGEDVSPYFYADFDEFRRDVHRIVAVGAEITADGTAENRYHAAITSLQNDDVNVVYRCSIRYAGEDAYEIAEDWTPDHEIDFSVRGDSGFTVRIEAGFAEDPYASAYREYSF